MDAWRICKAKHAATAFTGIGAEMAGGRWNFTGYKVVYTSSTLTLAKLEFFVQLTGRDAPDDLVYIKASVPADISQEEVGLSQLSKDWTAYPAKRTTKDLGTDWLKRGHSLILSVPSVVTPEERNYLLNPLHPEIERFSIAKPVKIGFDRRMWK